MKSVSHIEGYSDFVFVNRNGEVQHQGTLNKALQRIMRDCNSEVLEKKGVDSDPVLLPKWVNRFISCPEYVQSIYKMMNWNKDCRYKVYGRLANSERGLVLVFDLASAVMFDPLPEEYFDKHTGKMKKRIAKYYPDEIRMKLGRSYSDYEALQQRSSFEFL